MKLIIEYGGELLSFDNIIEIKELIEKYTSGEVYITVDIKNEITDKDFEINSFVKIEEIE